MKRLWAFMYWDSWIDAAHDVVLGSVIVGCLAYIVIGLIQQNH